VAVEGEALLWRPAPPRTRASSGFSQQGSDAGDDNPPYEAAELRGVFLCLFGECSLWMSRVIVPKNNLRLLEVAGSVAD